MWAASREEKAISISTADGLLLVHYEERHNRIQEEMTQLPSAVQPDSHSPTKFA